MEQPNIFHVEEIIGGHSLRQIVINQFQYEGGYKAVIPAMQADHLSITLGGTNIMERRLDGRRSRARITPGDLTLVPKGLPSVWIPDIAQSTVLHLLISPKLWSTIAQTVDIDPASIELRDDLATPDPLVEQLGRSLWAEVQNPGWSSQLYVQTLEQTLALHLLKHHTNRRDRAHPKPFLAAGNFKRTLDYIDAHLGSNLSLETLAACEGLSLYHFARQFKETVGQSPHQYVIHRRVQRARYLLKSTQLSIAQIASEVGFANQSHLNRHFKRIHGITPRQYRHS